MEQNQKSTRQNIMVLGANGGIGNQVVLHALNAGNTVTAILRTPRNLTITHPNLKIIQGDVLQAGTLTDHLRNTDVVISAIGSNSLKKTTLYSQGNKNLIEAMERTGVKRAFFISASGIDVNPSHSLVIRLATRFILQSILHNMYEDQLRMEVLIKESGINWTIVRPPKLINKPTTGNYRISTNGFLNNGLTISRADVADFIIQNLNNVEVMKKTIEIAY